MAIFRSNLRYCSKMKTITNSLLLVFLTAVGQVGLAQDRLPIGRWKSHLPNNSSKTIAVSGNTVYAGDVGTFFSYNIDNSSITSYSKIQGFSQTNVSQMGFSANTATTVIAYDNSQIDLVKDNTIFAVNDLNRANISGSKTINHLSFVNDLVLISTDFGLVVYNLTKREVVDVYQYFDSDGLVKKVNSSAVNEDMLFVATTTGLYAASWATSVNKLDYRNWKNISPADSIANVNVNLVSSYQNKLFVSCDFYLKVFTKGVWEDVPDLVVPLYFTQNSGNITAMKTIGDALYVLQFSGVFEYRNGVCTRIYYNDGAFITSIDKDKDGYIWLGTKNKGLFTNRFNSQFSAIKTSGPGFASVFKLSYFQGKVLAVSGGYSDGLLSQLGKLDGFSVYENGSWSSYKWASGNLPFFYDICNAKLNSVTNKVYFPSYGSGMLEWDQTSEFKVFNYRTPGCPLRTCTYPGGWCSAPDPGGNFCRVPDLAVDSKGAVWVLNMPDPNPSEPSLYRYNADKSWVSFPWSGTDVWGSFTYSVINDKQYFNSLIFVDKYDNKWIASRTGGVFVYNETKFALPRFLQYVKGTKEEICGQNIKCIASDLEGGVWLGTDNGVCFFSDPNEVFLNKTIKAAVPVYGNKALLKGETITSIDVDGSNRKWIGTLNSGVWLFSSDGSKLISHFEKENSPLPSSSIVDVKVNQSTGEVFIATDQGLMSFGGNSMLGTDENAAVIVYPNPITRDFDGFLAISGLANSSLVKITDISGKLVYQTKSEGSLASWNILDYTGSRPQPGIYLIFSSKEDGTETLVSKIAILD